MKHRLPAPIPVDLSVGTGVIPPPDLPFEGDAYRYDNAGGTGSIAGSTVQAGPNQSSPTGSINGGAVQPGPNQSSPTGSISGSTILPVDTRYD